MYGDRREGPLDVRGKTVVMVRATPVGSLSMNHAAFVFGRSVDACMLSTGTQVEDWFALKDTCPYALYDDQSRLYAAILRMQLRYDMLCLPARLFVC